MRLLKSASAMTWLAQGLRFAGFLLVLPMAIRVLPHESISVWLLLSTITSFQIIFDLGITPTFSREFAYGFAGRSLAARDRASTHEAGADEPDWTAIARSISALRRLYSRISAAYLAILLIVGTVVIRGPIGRMDTPSEGWIAWGVVILCSTASMYGNVFSAVLTGANKIHLIKRWESLTTAAGLVLQFLALYCGAGLIGLVLAAQLAAVAFLIARRYLARSVTRRATAPPADPAADAAVIQALWPSSWRTAVGALMSFGIAQGVVVAAANLLDARTAVSVQLAVRIMQIVSQVSQVPFYSRLPELNALRAKDMTGRMFELASNSMRTCLFIYVLGAIAVDLAAEPLLAYFGKGKTLPGHGFWLLISLAYFFERIGAMHINLLLTGNRAIAHVANAVTGVVWVAVLFLTWQRLGLLAIPASMLIAYAGFNAPWSTWKSHSALGDHGGFRLELSTSLPPLVLLATYAGVAAWMH